MNPFFEFTFWCDYQNSAEEIKVRAANLKQAEKLLLEYHMVESTLGLTHYFNNHVKIVQAFCRSDYWCNWKRCLGAVGYRAIWIDVTTINLVWSKCADESILNAGLYGDKQDIWGYKLPQTDEYELRQHVDSEVVDKLLMHDYLADLTWSQVIAANKASRGGGVPFEKIVQFAKGEIANCC